MRSVDGRQQQQQLGNQVVFVAAPVAVFVTLRRLECKNFDCRGQHEAGRKFAAGWRPPGNRIFRDRFTALVLWIWQPTGMKKLLNLYLGMYLKSFPINQVRESKSFRPL